MDGHEAGLTVDNRQEPQAVPVITFEHVTGLERLDIIRTLFREYADSLEIDLCFQGFEAELAALPGKYAPPDGDLILAFVDGQPAGCVAMRRLSKTICEMKRLYVRDAFRRYGLGRALATRIIASARAHGYRRMRLDTLTTMGPAMQLYESLGFRDTKPYIYNPHETVRYMELKLT